MNERREGEERGTAGDMKKKLRKKNYQNIMLEERSKRGDELVEDKKRKKINKRKIGGDWEFSSAIREINK